MGYRNLRECVDDLEQAGRLVRVAHEVDTHLEVAEIQRRLYQARGPAVLLSRVKGCAFPILANLFGTPDRARFLFRTLERRPAARPAEDRPARAARPWRHLGTARTAYIPCPVSSVADRCRARNHRVPTSANHQLADDGGPFVTPSRCLHRGPGSTRLATIQPRHVPGPAFGQ